MPLLQDEDRQYLEESFAALTRDVTLTVVAREPSRLVTPGEPRPMHDASSELKQITSEVAAVSARLRLEQIDPADDEERARALVGDRLPAVVFSSERSKGKLRFYGLPAGYEMSTMVATILDLGGAEPVLPDEIVERMGALGRDVHIQVFVTPSCPHCPPMARAAFQLAAASERITADVVEVQEFPDLARKYQIRGVPMTVVNESKTLLGAVPPQELLDAVEAAGAAE